MVSPNTAALALMDGSKQWLAWQQSNPGEKLIRGVQLKDVDRRSLVLNGYSFESCTFDATDLKSTDFRECIFKDCQFVGAKLRDSIFLSSKLTNVSFVSSDMECSKLSGAVLKHVIFDHANLCSSSLEGVEGEEVQIDGASMNGAVLNNCHIAGLRGSGVDLQGAKLWGAKLVGANLTSSMLKGANFSKADLTDAILTKAVLSPSDQLDPSGTRSNFFQAKLVGTVFISADLRSVDFNKAVLSGANLRSARVDAWTRFDDCPPPTDMQIDRYSLETLGNDYGGFTRGHRMVMKVFDDASIIKRQFSGVYRLTHSLALVAFLIPYVWFLVMRWLDASFQPRTGEAMTIIEAFFRFVLVGDESWREGWGITWSFGLFMVAVIYNAVRLYFLKTTLDLEMHERVYGLPAQYSLTGHRAFLYGAVRVGFWIYLIVITCNSIRFLMREFPIPIV
jgi:uncharacterized protein YjbI with pentapeptide repeats